MLGISFSRGSSGAQDPPSCSRPVSSSEPSRRCPEWLMWLDLQGDELVSVLVQGLFGPRNDPLLLAEQDDLTIRTDLVQQLHYLYRAPVVGLRRDVVEDEWRG